MLGFALSGEAGRVQGSLAKMNCFKSSSRISSFHCLHIKSTYKLKIVKSIHQLLLIMKLWFYIFIKRPNIVIHRDVPLIMISRYLFPRVFFVNEVHAIPWEEVKDVNILRRVLIWVYKSQFVWNLKKSNFVIFNHPFLERYYLEKYTLYMPTTFIYNGGSFENFQPYSAPDTCNTDDSIIFSYCGNINFWHGVDRIIPVLDELDKQGLKYKFYLVGGQDDLYTREVREKFRTVRNTQIIENREKSTLEAYIKRSDYCFLPVANVRTSPGNPIKLFDYVGLGKRVITQEYLPGYSDLLPTELGHLHIDFSNSSNAARYLCDNICKTDTEKEMKVYEFAEKNQSWDNMTDQWLDRIIDEIREGS